MRVRCQCGTSVMKAHGDVIKLRSRIVVLEKGRTLAKCMNCGAELEVPLQLKAAPEPDLLKAIPGLYVAK